MFYELREHLCKLISMCVKTVSVCNMLVCLLTSILLWNALKGCLRIWCMFGCMKCIMIPQLPWFLLSIALIPYPSENLQIHLSVPLNMFCDSKYACGWLMLVWGAFEYGYTHNETCVLSVSFKVFDHVAAWDCVITVPTYISLCVCQRIYTECGIL